MSAARRQGSGERGFALAETLIAVAIIAAMLGVTFQVILSTSRARQMLQDDRRAALLAQSVMARVDTDISLTPGVVRGRTDGMDWQVDIDRYAPPEAGSGAADALLIVGVSVKHNMGKRSDFVLKSLRLAS
jgi:type II secretory pathway component PulJ